MPFKSEAQRRYLWANEPTLARRWAEKYGSKTIRKKAVKKLKEGRNAGSARYQKR